jgi:hypothetical protein
VWDPRDTYHQQVTMNLSRLRKPIKRAVRAANRTSPAPSTTISSTSIVTGESLVARNRKDVDQVLQAVGAPVLYEESSPSRDMLYVSIDYLNDVLQEGARRIPDGVCYEAVVRFRGRRMTMQAESQILGRSLLAFAKAGHVDSLLFFRFFCAESDRKFFSKAFGVGVRFVREADGWWINEWSDVGSTPVQFSWVSDLDGPTISELQAPIDAVYTWVDGDDPVWQDRRDTELAARGHKIPERSANRSRWEDREELRYSLRSLALYAPWIRNIYIVTDDQVPGWLSKECDRVTIVDHREIFPDSDALPTFNSHAIEANLHRISAFRTLSLHQ